MNKNILANLLPDELENLVLSLGFEKYRAKQIFHSLNNLNESLRGLKPEQKKILLKKFFIQNWTVQKKLSSNFLTEIWSRAFLCAMISEIPAAFPRRWGAEWAVCSALRERTGL